MSKKISKIIRNKSIDIGISRLESAIDRAEAARLDVSRDAPMLNVLNSGIMLNLDVLRVSTYKQAIKLLQIAKKELK
jgi:hypothetical protein